MAKIIYFVYLHIYIRIFHQRLFYILHWWDQLEQTCALLLSHGEEACCFGDEISHMSVKHIYQVEVAKRKDVKLPNGWGTNSSGENCTDPREVLKSGGLYPLGGPEETSE